jgi:hypothetical protein
VFKASLTWLVGALMGGSRVDGFIPYFWICVVKLVFLIAVVIHCQPMNVFEDPYEPQTLIRIIVRNPLVNVSSRFVLLNNLPIGSMMTTGDGFRARQTTSLIFQA